MFQYEADSAVRDGTWHGGRRVLKGGLGGRLVRYARREHILAKVLFVQQMCGEWFERLWTLTLVVDVEEYMLGYIEKADARSTTRMLRTTDVSSM
jgi:hypothetical protein